MAGLLTFTKNGIFCLKGGFYIDPWKPVEKAVITHAHSDHARRGHKMYLSHHLSIPVLKYRLGEKSSFRGIEYREKIKLNGVEITLFPAGHLPGSAQIRVRDNKETWVVTGDYKIHTDPLSTPFEPVKCNYLISECTFGLPVYKWEKREKIVDEINEWWKRNREENLTSLLLGYSLGKAQQLLASVDRSIGPVFVHGAVKNINDVFISAGLNLPDVPLLDASVARGKILNSLVIAPPSALRSAWTKRFTPFSSAMASGWMMLRGAKRWRATDVGFALSDHADWDGLNLAVKESGAEKVYVTHGYTHAFSKWLNENNIDSEVMPTPYTGEGEEEDVKA